ncbi:MAG: carboxymuconolactone decarboxylase family protein [Caulobacteraceae bacterium]|nr:carboxymuconolactone decarboxylase family protein [Caulobacteraceae bacterium]
MPNIPYRTEFDGEAERVAAATRERRGGRLLNLDRMLLHSPPLAEGWAHLFSRVRKGYRLSPLHRELAICAVARLNGADYEFNHHIGPFVAAGGAPGQVEALVDIEAASKDTALFGPAERAVLAMARDSTRDVRIGEATLAAVRQAFPDPDEFLELLMVIASYNMVSRVLVGLGVEPENASVGERVG